MQQLDNGDVLIDGLVLVSDVNERFELALDEEGYETRPDPAGLILAKLGSDRKALGLCVNEHLDELGPCRRAIFLLLDGKRDRLEKIIMDLIYPLGNRFVGE